MDERLKSFLEKFAELERRVRKLAVEDRGLREEVRRLRQRLSEMEAENATLRTELSRRQACQQEARERLTRLIDQLASMHSDEDSSSSVEVVSGEL